MLLPPVKDKNHCHGGELFKGSLREGAVAERLRESAQGREKHDLYGHAGSFRILLCKIHLDVLLAKLNCRLRLFLPEEGLGWVRTTFFTVKLCKQCHGASRTSPPTVYNNVRCADITFVRSVCLIMGEHSSPLRCYRIFYKKREGKPLPYGVKGTFI